MCALSGEDLRYDASWIENGASVRITDNGEPLTSGARGTFHWTGTRGAHTLTLELVGADGMVQNTEKVRFLVDCVAPELTLVGELKSGVCQVDLGPVPAGLTVYYTLDGTEPTSASRIYTQPFTLGTVGFCQVRVQVVDTAGDVWWTLHRDTTLSWGGAVTALSARQRYPWNGLVDIDVTLSGALDDMSQVDCFFAATNRATGGALPIVHVIQNGADTGSGTTWTRKFIWDAKADIGAVKIERVALTVEAKFLGGVQRWENGPYWAECNAGPRKPEGYGYYFWWGDTVGYMRNGSRWDAVDGSRTGFSFSSGNCPTYGTSVSLLQSAGYIDSTGNLVAAHDAATAHLGAPWRMPTDAEISALISNCTATWTTRNGVYGRLVAGKGTYASKSIFLPAAGYGYGSDLDRLGSGGYFWSSTPYLGNSYYAWDLYFVSGYFLRDYDSRDRGQSVRPVRGFAK